ncbi:MAG: hypothetical protein JO247_08370 [Chloroflexi bacterium]|nr:hypothetical protein [Chloroflexota bacterium]
MLLFVSALTAVLALMLILKLSQRLTLRLRVLAGVSISRQPAKACPHLGAAADPFTHEDRPSEDHRCYLWMQRDRIDLVHQKGFCLTSAHHKCPWLMVRRPDAPQPITKRLPVWGRAVPAQAWALACAFAASVAGVPAWLRTRKPARPTAATKAVPARSGRATATAVSVPARTWSQAASAAVGIGQTEAAAASRGLLDAGSHRVDAPAAAAMLDGAAASLAAERSSVSVPDSLADAQGARAAVAFIPVAAVVDAQSRAAQERARRKFGLQSAGLGARLQALALALRTTLARFAAAIRAALAAGAQVAAQHGGRFGAASVRFVRTYGPPAAALTARAVRASARLIGRAAVLAARYGWLALRWTARGVWRLGLAAGTRFDVSVQAWMAARKARRAQLAAAVVADAMKASAVAASLEPAEITQPVAVTYEGKLADLDQLIAEGLATLDRGQESLAYHLFAKATEHRLGRHASAEDQGQHGSLLLRAWFWRAKTAETVEDVVQSLEQALLIEPGNLQMQAHLAWARQRLEREHKLQVAAATPEQPAPFIAYTPPAPRKPGFGAALGEGVRVLGGMAALALAVLWMTAAVVPALGHALASLPTADQVLIQRVLLTINSTALPGSGHLDLPVANYDLGLSLPFVLGFLFVFTARGMVDGDRWARKGAMLLAALGGWLCYAAVTNPDAARLGLGLSAGIVVAAIAGRFNTPEVVRGTKTA